MKRRNTTSRGHRQRHSNTETYNRALHALARMRRTGESLAAAAREEHIDPRTVRTLFPEELKKVDGHIQATKSDRRRRDMLIPTSGGAIPVVIHGSEEASQLGRYMAAVGLCLRKGDTDALEEFEGQSMAGHLLITDPEQLSALAQAGALQLDEIYALEASS